MKSLFLFGAALAGAVSALPASATVIQATFTGRIIQFSDDLGLFGPPGAPTNSIATTFSFRYDTALGVRGAEPPFGDLLQGGAMIGASSAILSSSVKINGKTVSGGNAGYSSVGIVADPVSGQGFMIGGRSNIPGQPSLGQWSVLSAHFYAPSLTVPASIDVPFGMSNLDAVNGEPGGQALGYLQFNDCPVLNVCTTTFGYAVIDTFQSQIVPAAVPLPAAGGLLIGALGAVGVLGGRRRRGVTAG